MVIWLAEVLCDVGLHSIHRAECIDDSVVCLGHSQVVKGKVGQSLAISQGSLVLARARGVTNYYYPAPTPAQA